MAIQKKQTPILLLLCISFITLFLTSALAAPNTEKTKIIDDAGRTVLLTRIPVSIISLSPSNTEILFAIGAGDEVVGVTDYCNYPQAALKVRKVGGFSDVSIEKIVELKPDIVFASNLHISKIVPALSKLGIAVVVIDPVKVVAVFDSIKLVGRITNKVAESEKLVTTLQARYNELSAMAKKAEKPLVFWELSDDLWTIGKGSFIDDLLTEAGGYNIASSLDSPWLQLSAEYVIKTNPRFVFLADFPYGTTAGVVGKRPGWNSIDAVKSHNLIEVSSEENDIVSRPGPRVVDALEYIMRRLHRNLF